MAFSLSIGRTCATHTHSLTHSRDTALPDRVGSVPHRHASRSRYEDALAWLEMIHQKLRRFLHGFLTQLS